MHMTSLGALALLAGWPFNYSSGTHTKYEQDPEVAEQLKSAAQAKRERKAAKRLKDNGL